MRRAVSLPRPDLRPHVPPTASLIAFFSNHFSSIRFPDALDGQRLVVEFAENLDAVLPPLAGHTPALPASD
jgi:hypothetical protein